MTNKYSSAANDLFAALNALKARSPSSLGRIGDNGVDGDVSVLPFPRQRSITAIFDAGHMAQLSLDEAKWLTEHLNSGGSLPLFPGLAAREADGEDDDQAS